MLLTGARCALEGDTFQKYSNQFLEAAPDTILEATPLPLNKSKLKTELSVIYSYNEYRNCTCAVALHQLFMGNNRQDPSQNLLLC